MSILESMRTGSDSTLMQIVLAAVVVSFVGWGVGAGSGNTTQTIATVNGDTISGVEFNRAYRMAEQQRSQRSKGGISEDEREQLREKVVQDLVRQRAMLQEARQLGLEVSAAEIAEELFSYSFLLDENGVFDKRAFDNFLRRQGLTRADFEEQIREELTIRKLQGLMILGASVSDTLVQRTWAEENTKLDLQVVRIRPGALDASVQPTEAELATWLAEHKADVQARYDTDLAARYDLPELVTVRLLRLALRDDGLGTAELKPKLEGLRAELEGGADFAALAARWSEDPSAAEGGLVADLPLRDVDAGVATALGALKEGELSPVLITGRDLRVYRLEQRTPARTIPLAEVEADIARELYREQQGPARAAAFAEKELLPAWKASGTAPLELLEPVGLSVTSTGLVAPASMGLVKPPEALIKAARAAAPGDVLPEVFEDNGTLWVGALVAREDPDAATFEQDKPRIREQALLRHRIDFFESWVDDVVARANVVR